MGGLLNLDLAGIGSDPKTRGLFNALLMAGGDKNQPWSEQPPVASNAPPANPSQVNPGKTNLPMSESRIQDDQPTRAGSFIDEAPAMASAQRGSLIDAVRNGSGGGQPDFVDQAPQMASSARMNLAQQMQQGQQGQQPQAPDHMQQLQSQYDKLGRPVKGPGLLGKILLGATAPFGSLSAYAEERDKQQQMRGSQRNNLLNNIEAERRMQEQEQLNNIEAERRMQEQEQLSTDRMTLQQKMENDRLQHSSDMAQPEHLDSDQGPLQYNRNTKSWEPITIGGKAVGPKAQPKPDTPEQQFLDSPDEQGKTLTEKITDYAAVSQKPDKPGSESGTWSLQEDSQGNPVEFNSKTGQTRPAPDVHKPGTYQKTQGAANDALNYATLYEKQTPTGPGDEALMEKFFELAKPSSGFRMTQNQMDMLKNARSWMGSAEAIQRHATTGTWFSDEQRKQIGSTMKTLADAKGQGGQDGGKSGAKLKDRAAGRVLVEGKDF